MRYEFSESSNLDPPWAVHPLKSNAQGPYCYLKTRQFEPGPFWPSRRVAKNDANGSCVVVQSDLSSWPRRGGEPYFAGPCPNFKGANDLDELSVLADGENTFAILYDPRRNCKTLKAL